ncbi:hypothetical protein SISSUDRAFT_786710 [Sistotremastrum suecicum HHB10207 ss-3]|uniref:Uncharacterized protein n=1 Tax=Sistotremastrum suecicum HHB10207 ss-3 TaxID=1314776 RepID=A0A166D0C1_9AGAM|nr:hypothetical protein SISSUDRAFT_786710 [Sistotremastrum suecicum HHB10207 ss-3]
MEHRRARKPSPARNWIRMTKNSRRMIQNIVESARHLNFPKLTWTLSNSPSDRTAGRNHDPKARIHHANPSTPKSNIKPPPLLPPFLIPHPLTDSKRIPGCTPAPEKSTLSKPFPSPPLESFLAPRVRRCIHLLYDTIRYDVDREHLIIALFTTTHLPYSTFRLFHPSSLSSSLPSFLSQRFMTNHPDFDPIQNRPIHSILSSSLRLLTLLRL